MNLLGKTIHKIILIDFFSEEERIENKVSLTLSEFLKKSHVETICFYPNSNEEMSDLLIEIPKLDINNGVVIHLIGHGGKQYFGNNKNVLFEWLELNKLLTNINLVTNDSLIVNATLLCDGFNILEPMNTIDSQKHFYAAIYSKTKRSNQTLRHNIDFYQKCFNNPDSIKNLEEINDIIEDNQDERPYDMKIL